MTMKSGKATHSTTENGIPCREMAVYYTDGGRNTIPMGAGILYRRVSEYYSDGCWNTIAFKVA